MTTAGILARVTYRLDYQEEYLF